MKLTSIDDLQIPGALALEGLAQTLSKLYDDFLDDFPEEDDREPGIHASELCSCLRQTFYTLLSVPKERKVEAFWRKRFEVGKAIHDMIQRHFELMAAHSGGRFTFEKEVKVNDTPLARELYLASSCDGVFTFFEQSYPILRVGLEIKSKSEKEYVKLKGPEDKHVDQSIMYMKTLDLPLVWYLYWDKTRQCFTPTQRPYLARFDPVIWAKLEARAHKVLAMAERNQLPEREEGIHCRWCPYQYTCLPPSVKAPHGGRVHLPLSGRR